ncbi:hypothetical protein BX661DRAFT_175819 [Kickxella alabastrina]|uniref:uncharacterized protein n=1 Tax=Kickxella alabastrina TaxID=61397 RepID=UPI00221EF46F|nr:uncharacterized protein BX661DRAFT_175819 [Kickxella alabastrina]KAI7834946.1 hypothetical protein BX661DRAFT_175819 [Kickxella alabastrina]
MRDFLRFAHDSSDCVAAAEITALEEDARAEADILRLRMAGASADASADAERRHWLQRAEQLDAQTWSFVEECEPAAGLPQLEPPGAQAQRDGVLRWLNDDCDEPLPDTGTGSHRPSIEAYAAARFPDNPMWRGMADNVDRLRSIREIDSKIWAAKLNIPLGHLHPHSAAPRALDDPAPCARAIHATYANTADPPGGLRLDHHCARALLHRTTALILAHTGFDSITAAAASTLNAFFIDYMANLGRSLRTYTDKHARTMSSEAILAHALYDNGIEDLGELEYYARGDVAKHHTKLCEVQKKLSKAFQDTMADGRLDAEPVDAGLDTGDAYVTGSVGGGLADLGDDFFGFKELGLDKEFGLESLSVPQRLWYARPPGSADGAGLTPYQQQQEALAHPQPKAWPPLRTPRGQIGLLHPFICEKLKHINAVECVPGFTADGRLLAKEEGEDNEDEDEDGAYALPDTWVPVPEDESLPTRLRYGATRVKVPPPNYLTHPRTHMHVGSGQVPDTPTTAGAGAGRNAKKRPVKNTASKTTATATTIGKASRKKSAGA